MNSRVQPKTKVPRNRKDANANSENANFLKIWCKDGAWMAFLLISAFLSLDPAGCEGEEQSCIGDALPVCER